MNKILKIAAMALMISACSSNDMEETVQQPNNKAEGIPFVATIRVGESATTRALTEDGVTIVPSWAEGDKVALIHGSINDEMTVSSVSDGVATITGTITGTPANGDAVTIIYPSSAADGATGNVKANLLASQDGTLSTIAKNYDVRTGSGTLNVGATASLHGNVSLDNEYAIFKFTIKNYDGSAAINLKAGEPFIITIGDVYGTQSHFITPASAMSELYVALHKTTNKTVRFYATGSDSKAYAYTKGKVTFDAGNYYQSELKLKSTDQPGSGQFTINGSGNKVKFSKGNLQAIYDGSSWTWVFAPEQWDYIGDKVANTKINGNGTIDGTGTVDLFGWSTAATYYGINNSTSSSTYSGDFVDWGNTIGGGWRTLTKDQWVYLLNTRSGGTANGSSNARYTFAQLPDAKGIILFPDGVTIAHSEASSWGAINNYSSWGTRCSEGQWAALEAKGCVFLPAAGYYWGFSIKGSDSEGRYWSSTSKDASTAYDVYFKSDKMDSQHSGSGNRNDRYSVRLVRDAE